MSGINNPSAFTPGSIDVVLPQHNDEVLGVVTGLPSTPAHVITCSLYEEGVTVQSGLVYEFNAYQLNSAGFNWRLRVLGDEWWPGPSSVTIKVNYAWSAV
jgi:hypothetical protein